MWDNKLVHGTNIDQGVNFVNDLIEVEKLLVPEMLDLLELRYDILNNIFTNAPIGRRVLSLNLKIGERIVRKEVDKLKDYKMVTIDASGIMLTDKGIQVIRKTEDIIHSIRGLNSLECQLRQKLNLQKVIIVPGDSEKESLILEQLGLAAGHYLKEILRDDYKIAITGGTTIKKVVDNTPSIISHKNVLVLPARGSIGKNVNIQANTLTAILADKLGASYSLLHMDDNISNETLNVMMKEKQIRRVTENYDMLDVLLFGIGKAEVMAERRGLPQEKIAKIKEAGAFGEAFGYYYDDKGKIVYSSTTVGIKINQIRNIKHRIAVSAGKSKARAIVSVLKFDSDVVLITDEAAARELLSIL